MSLRLVRALACITIVFFQQAVEGEMRAAGRASLYRTTNDMSLQFVHSTVPYITTDNTPTSAGVLTIDVSHQYQQMEGIGAAITGTSALMIHSLPEAAQDQLLEELFSPTNESGIHISFIRTTIGASDLSEKPYTYDDLASCNDTDEDMNNFSLDFDRQYVIPILKKIVAIRPDISIVGSPWSPPTWMKDNCHWEGGTIKPEAYQAYAKYFVKYIKGMAEEGINITAITPQNEPLWANNTPSMYWAAEDEASFIKNALGPAFHDNNISTKIIAYDYNTNYSYPLDLLADTEAAERIDGISFHLYDDVNFSYFDRVHDTRPDKNVYMLERGMINDTLIPDEYRSLIGGHPFWWHMANVVIGSSNNWAKGIITWGLAADENDGPHTDGGCPLCMPAIMVNFDNQTITREPPYYVLAHSAKFVSPGSWRVNVTADTTASDIAATAFITPSGDRVVVAVNTNNETSTPVTVAEGNKKTAEVRMEPLETITFVLPGGFLI